MIYEPTAAAEPLQSATEPRIQLKVAVRLDSSHRVRELERELRLLKSNLEGAAKDALALAADRQVAHLQELDLRRRAERQKRYWSRKYRLAVGLEEPPEEGEPPEFLVY